MKIKLALLAAVAALAMLPNLTMAQQQVKGAQLLMKLQTTDNLQQVEAGDTIVMSCPKCKDTYATVVTKSMKGMQPEQMNTMVKHMCPTCSTEIKTEGMGKNAVNKLVHTCNACGSTEVTCCLMKKNGGATMGMEDDKK
jgi:predicted outer membrane protein